MINANIFPPLISLLANVEFDVEIKIVCLDCLENILRVGETKRNAGITNVNVYGRLIEDAGGLDKIENLQIQENRFVYLKSAELLDNYFEEEDADMLTMSDT